MVGAVKTVRYSTEKTRMYVFPGSKSGRNYRDTNQPLHYRFLLGVDDRPCMASMSIEARFRPWLPLEEEAGNPESYRLFRCRGTSTGESFGSCGGRGTTGVHRNVFMAG